MLEAKKVLAQLRHWPSPEREVDLLPRILARVGSEKARAHPRRIFRFTPRAAVVAAVLLLALGVSWGIRQSSRHGVENSTEPTRFVPSPLARPDPDTAVARALEWLAQAQESSGQWSAARWGGQARYDVGLTGLASLTLLLDTPTPQTVRPLAHAVDFLLTQQAQDGRIGPELSGSIYNHAIATVALIESFGCLREERLREPIERALRHLQRLQSTRGAWGYPGEPLSEANSAATCWPLQALLLARALGWKGLDASIEAGFSYLARACDDAGRIGYRRAGDFRYGSEGLSSMGAFCLLLAGNTPTFPAQLQHRLLDRIARASGTQDHAPRDLYRDFFVSSALTAIPPGHGGGPRKDVCLLLAAEQVQEGPYRGTWKVQDPWGSVGGRLYSTTLSVLILTADQRGRRLTEWMTRKG